MARKYAALVLVLAQVLTTVGMEKTDQSQTTLNGSTDVLSRSGGLSQSQELTREIKRVAASYCAISPCFSLARFENLLHDWKPISKDGYNDCP